MPASRRLDRLPRQLPRYAERKTTLNFLICGRCVPARWLSCSWVLSDYLIFEGIGIWGLNVPVAWGWAIVNFVFWVGIGHAGTLISAILFLFRQRWRTSINRFAEAMTIFAVICALLFPAIHVGRIWVVYWMLPLPNQMADVAAISDRRCCGTCLRWGPTSPVRCSSGMSV